MRSTITLGSVANLTFLNSTANAGTKLVFKATLMTANFAFRTVHYRPLLNENGEDSINIEVRRHTHALACSQTH